MTDWNPSNPFDLGIWDQLGWTPPRHPHEDSDDDADTAKIPPAKKSKRDDEQASVSSKKSKLQLKKKRKRSVLLPPKKIYRRTRSRFAPKTRKLILVGRSTISRNGKKTARDTQRTLVPTESYSLMIERFWRCGFSVMRSLRVRKTVKSTPQKQSTCCCVASSAT